MKVPKVIAEAHRRTLFAPLGRSSFHHSPHMPETLYSPRYVFMDEPRSSGAWHGSWGWKPQPAWRQKLCTAAVALVALLTVFLVVPIGPVLLSRGSSISDEELGARSECGAAVPRVLVTGFGAFENVTHNPAEHVARRVNGRCKVSPLFTCPSHVTPCPHMAHSCHSVHLSSHTTGSSSPPAALVAYTSNPGSCQ